MYGRKARRSDERSQRQDSGRDGDADRAKVDAAASPQAQLVVPREVELLDLRQLRERAGDAASEVVVGEVLRTRGAMAPRPRGGSLLV